MHEIIAREAEQVVRELFRDAGHEHAEWLAAFGDSTIAASDTSASPAELFTTPPHETKATTKLTIERGSLLRRMTLIEHPTCRQVLAKRAAILWTPTVPW